MFTVEEHSVLLLVNNTEQVVEAKHLWQMYIYLSGHREAATAVICYDITRDKPIFLSDDPVGSGCYPADTV